VKISRKKILNYILIGLVYIVLAIFLYLGWQSGDIQRFIRGAGVFAPILYLFFATLKAVFPIIPGEVLITVGVIAFGPWVGFILAELGLTMGSAIAFLIARKYGTGVVLRIMGKERFEKVHKLTGDKTLFTFFLIYLTPGSPDDFVTYIAGLTSINFWLFLLICVAGRTPTYILYVLAGQSLRTLNYKLLIFWWAALFLLAGLLYPSKKHVFDRFKRK
jgi:uncharacterized membrane protein YdjX (TVP38/TMEM64 family)